MEPIHISVVSPIYGCKACLFELYERLERTLSTITQQFEIILINDACPQNSWEVISLLAQKDRRVKGINLSRNFGQHYAITAGLDHAKGEWVVVITPEIHKEGQAITKEDILELELPPKQKAKLLSKLTGLSVKECYNAL